LPNNGEGEHLDGRRFDDMTRGVGAASTRRRVVAAALGLAAATVGSDAVDAQRATCRANGASCGRHPQCCTGYCQTSRQAPRRLRNRCACPSGECDRVCVDFDSDPVNCGRCDNVCPAGYTCDAGDCLCGGDVCGDGEVCLSGACLSTVDNDANCGEIGNVCGAGKICLNSACREILPLCGAYNAVLVTGETKCISDYGPSYTACSLTSPCAGTDYCVAYLDHGPGNQQDLRPGQCYRLALNG